jgi:hypothetical protein
VFLSAGTEVSAYQTAYGLRDVTGFGVYGDLHFRSSVALEGEARQLRWHTAEDVTESSFVVGPRVELLRRGRLRPYAKLLVGGAILRFPFDYGRGTYFAMVPGAGVEFRLSDRVTLRPVDVEYQTWTAFTFGAMHPYGISAGLSVRLTRPNLFRRDPYVE